MAQKISLLLGVMALYCTSFSQSYVISYLEDAGNPGGINSDSYFTSTGWTEIFPGGGGSNVWTDDVSIPFPFEFYGSTVTHLKVSLNGVVTFDTAATLIPGDNLGLPTNTLPDSSIACFWDAYTTNPPLSTSDDIDIKTFGTAPNRQFWIRWQGFELNGNSNVYMACVLEETTNKIYVVDRYSSNSSGLSATVGVQLNSTTGNDVGSNLTVSGNGTGISDNDYYEFIYIPAGVCIPPLSIAVEEYTATTATIVWEEGAAGSTFTLEYGQKGFNLGSGTVINGITDTFRVVTGLSSYEDYDFYVSEDCLTGSTSPEIGPASILTAATDGWIEDFSGSYLPNGWQEAQGDIDNPTSFSNSTSSGWGQDEFSNTGSNDAANELISGTTNDEWLLTPSIYLPPGHSLNLEFDASLTVNGANLLGQLGSDDTIHVVISTDNGQTWNRSDAILTLDENTTFYAEGGAHYTLSLSAYTGLVKIGFYTESQVTNQAADFFLDNVQLRPAVSCPQPFGLTASNITSTTLDISWVTNGGTNFNVIWGVPGFNQATATVVNVTGGSYTITGLNPYTEYEIHLWNDCGGGSISDTATISSVITAIQPAWLEDFSSGFPPFGWDERQGRLSNATQFSSFTSAGWTSDDFGNTGSDNSARETVSGTVNDEWLLTPLIDLGTGTDYQLEFDAALTSSNGTSQGAFGPDDTAHVVISTDAGITWSRANSLIAFSSGTEPLSTGSRYLVDLTGYTGVIQFGFYMESTVSNASNDFFVDNVEVKPIPSCPSPFNLVASGDGDSVTISWSVVPPTSSPYTLSYGLEGFMAGSGTQITGITDTFITVQGLSFNTIYDFYVLGDCGGTASLYGNAVTYTTPCDVLVAPLTENFDTWTAGTGTTTAGDVLDACWDRDPNTTSTYSWRVRTGSTPSSTTGPDQDNTSGSGNYVFTEASSTFSSAEAILITPFIDISPLNLPSLEFYYHMYGDDIDRLIIEIDDGTNIFTDVIIGEQQGNNSDPWELYRYNLAAIPLASDTVQVRLKALKQSSSDADIAIDDFQIVEATVCGEPINLGVQNVTSTSADLIWSSGSGLSNIEWGPSGFSQGSGVGNIIRKETSPYILGGLSPNMEYDFYVQDTCSSLSTNSSWVGPFTFKTRCTSLLNGTYTIGGPVGPNNFPTLDSAVSVLNACGIGGPVIFDIAPGTYNESVIIDSVAGTSAVNTVTFTSADRAATIITNSVSSAVITLDGSDYFRFRNLTIQNAKSGSEAVGIFLTNRADHNIIDSCSFIIQSTDSETSSIFAGDDSTTVNTSANGINARDLIISNSSFNGGYYSIIVVGNDNDVTTTSGITIENNVFAGFDEVALSIQDYEQINIIGDSVLSIAGRYAFDLDNTFNFNISGNYIRNLGTVATFSIFGGNDDPAVPLNGRSVISNNIIHSTNNWSLFLFEVEHTDIVNNTLYSDESDNLYFSSVDNMRVYNNIMYAPKGVSFTFSGGAPPTATNEVDYNIYYPLRTNNFSNAIIPVIADGGTDYTLAGWQAAQSAWDQNSKAGDPEFVSASDLHVQGFLAENAGTNTVVVAEDYDGDTRSSTTPDIGADEFTAVACPMPTALDVQNVTSTAADLIWLGVGSAYEVEWGEVGFAINSGTRVSAATTTLNLSALSPGIIYDFYVRNDCSPNPSDWAGPFSFVTDCGSPLNGVYTIDQSIPSSPTNFNSVRSAAASLTKCGISGPVVFNIAAGTYNGPVLFGSIPGSSLANTVMFEGASTSSVIISSTGSEILGNQATILLDSTDYVTFRNVTIQNTASSEAWGVLLTHIADHNSFINCHFDMPVTTSADVAGLISSNSPVSDNSAGNNASYLLIDSCHFSGGEKGIVISGTSTGFNCTNVQISNSLFESMDEMGMDIIDIDTILIHGNTIRDITDAATSFGIEMDDVNNFTVSANFIQAADEGISIDDGNDGNNPTVKSEVFNNMIIAGGDHGADIIDVTNVNIYHNTIVGEPAIEIDDHDAMVIKNNIFYGRASEAFLSADLLGSLTKVDIDYNLYYGSDTIAEYPIDIDGTDYATLADWIAADNTRNANSVEGDPLFFDVTSALHVEGPLANEAGDNTVGITIDIDGETRPGSGATIVDIGADEFVPATCLVPGSIEQLSSTASSVELNWTSGGATDWQIEYGPEDFTLGNGTLAGVTSIPHTISGLASYTCYDVYIRDSCAAGDVSRWVGPFKACTDFACSVASIPTVTGDTLVCVNDTVILVANTNTDFPVWKDASGYIIFQDDSLVINGLDKDTSFTVQDAQIAGPQFEHVGPLTNIATAGFGNFSNGLMFTAISHFRLDSVTLKSSGARAGNINIWQPDSITNDNINTGASRLIQSVPYDLSAAGDFQVPVGVVLSPGKYFINLSYGAGTGELFRSTSGADFPYVLPNVVSIDSSVGASNFPSTRVYYLFDWVVSGVCVGPQENFDIDTVNSAPVAAFNVNLNPATQNDLEAAFDAAASSGSNITYTWDFGDGNNGTGENPTHTYTANGSYQVELIVENACGSDTISQTVVIEGIGLGENIIDRTLEIFPNPSSGNVHVSFNTGGSQKASIHLVDVSGRIVKTIENDALNGKWEVDLDISKLSDGVYMLQISTDEIFTVRRVVKN